MGIKTILGDSIKKLSVVLSGPTNSAYEIYFGIYSVIIYFITFSHFYFAYRSYAFLFLIAFNSLTQQFHFTSKQSNLLAFIIVVLFDLLLEEAKI